MAQSLTVSQTQYPGFTETIVDISVYHAPCPPNQFDKEGKNRCKRKACKHRKLKFALILLMRVLFTAMMGSPAVALNYSQNSSSMSCTCAIGLTLNLADSSSIKGGKAGQHLKQGKSEGEFRC